MENCNQSKKPTGYFKKLFMWPCLMEKKYDQFKNTRFRSKALTNVRDLHLNYLNSFREKEIIIITGGIQSCLNVTNATTQKPNRHSLPTLIFTIAITPVFGHRLLNLELIKKKDAFTVQVLKILTLWVNEHKASLKGLDNEGNKNICISSIK